MKKLSLTSLVLVAACAKEPNMAEILFKEEAPKASCTVYAPLDGNASTQIVRCLLPATDGSEPVEFIVYKAPGRRLGYMPYLTPTQEQKRKEAEAKAQAPQATPPAEGQGSGTGAPAPDKDKK